MNYIEILGFVAAIATTFSMVPQAIQIWKTKSAKDINLLTFGMLSTGIFLWFVYGLMIKSNPIIYANLIGFFISTSIIYTKIKFG